MSYYVYLLTNPAATVLYAGVTNDLSRRVNEHKQKLTDGFTSRYNVNRLVYYEVFEDVVEAISREKQIKGGSRRKKMELVDGFNPAWRDLYEEVLG
jgi:putative endonuclease